jgi:hypothetical protein
MGTKLVEAPSREKRFVATLALSKPSVASANAVVERVKTAFAAMKFDIKVPETKLETLHKGFILKFEGVALPSEVCSELIARERVWKGANQALNRHAAQAVVATIDPVVDHKSALNAAAYVTFIAGALCSLLPTEAVIWLPAGTLTQGQRFAMAAAELSRKQLPIMSWVRFDAARHEKSAGTAAPTSSVRTKGMLPFVGRELYCGSRLYDLPKLAGALIELANALVVRGPFIQNGDAVTVPPLGHGVARYDRSNDDRKFDVLVLEVDSGEVNRHAEKCA